MSQTLNTRVKVTGGIVDVCQRLGMPNGPQIRPSQGRKLVVKPVWHVAILGRLQVLVRDRNEQVSRWLSETSESYCNSGCLPAAADDSLTTTTLFQAGISSNQLSASRRRMSERTAGV